MSGHKGLRLNFDVDYLDIFKWVFSLTQLALKHEPYVDTRSHTLRGFEHLGEIPVVSFDLACKWALLEYVTYHRRIIDSQFFTIATDLASFTSLYHIPSIRRYEDWKRKKL